MGQNVGGILVGGIMTSSPSFCQVMEGRGKPVARQSREVGRETLASVRLDTLLTTG